MKRLIILLTAFMILAIPANISAADLEIKKIDKGAVVISELQNPAAYTFIITNNGVSDYFEIYSLLDVSMGPKGSFSLPHGESTIEVLAYPGKEIRATPGFLNFEYQLKGKNTGIFKDSLLIKIVRLEDVIELSAKPLPYNSQEATIMLKNKENTRIDDLRVSLESPFFTVDKIVSFEPYEEVNISVQLNSEGREKLLAGPYIMDGIIGTSKTSVNVKGVIDYLEKEGTSIHSTTEGWVVREKTIVKKNEGNVPVNAQIEIKKDILSRLFTLNSPDAMSASREGFSVVYTWQKELAPNESFSVSSKTNYTFPLILLIFIVIAGLLARMYSLTALVLSKKVSFVKTKSGVLALKVTIHAKARKHIDKVQIIDTLPAMTKLYEKFGKAPDRIDKTGRRIYWNIEKLSASEERVYSYIIYSNLKIVGRFELPATTAIFEKSGKVQEVWSNRAYFATENAS